MNDIKHKPKYGLNKILSQKYKHGFTTKIEKEYFPPGLNHDILNSISERRKDPYFLTKFRQGAYSKWLRMEFPLWANLKIKSINFESINFCSIPKRKKIKSIAGSLDNKILKTFEKLGISLKENKDNPQIAIDAVFDSISVGTTYKDKLAKTGVIFCSISDAIKHHPALIKKYLGVVVPPGDNYFAALNSAVFTDGSFCYIPKNIKCPLELSTYFRINDKDSGQFERTLIIAEKGSSVSYLEGCTAPKFSENQLHAAVVELIAFDSATINYSTVQNWFQGNEQGIGGIYNFVTKRGLCIGKNSKITWTQVETGSSVTWKYPSCVLLGKESSGEFYSIALTNNYQQADTGTKMVHIGEKTVSKIISKGISCGNSKNTYRGLVKICGNAVEARNFSQCDSFLIGPFSTASTYPYFDIWNSLSKVEHEAKISKISEEQLFYLAQRGIKAEQAISLLITGYCKDVVVKLPMEFAQEANKLLELKLEGNVG
uniref:Iron-sulfur cluster formation ABC transporter n=1 Tax=Pedospumella sp. Jangsampo120217C5 TaxID=2782409 RepID=A0A7S6PUZ6_9STRA|nr:iron-sulfur cluster formation ABC transporter [Pedospumella sp. Jangsampo120217C5]